MAIREVSRGWVKPFPPVDSPKELPLSDLDVIQVPYHIPVIFVYRSGGSSEAAKASPPRESGTPTTALLKESLARTLAAFYPLGGRIGNRSGRPAVYRFNDGVPFIESECTSDIPSDAHLQPSQFSSELLATPTPGIGGTPQGVPVMSVKVTQFRCGGLVIGVSFHHQIVDAAAFFTFMGAWAGVARGKPPPSPSLDRTVLIDRDERTDGGPENGRPQPSSLWGSAFATWQQHASFWRAYADLRWRSLGQKEGLLRVTFSREEVAWLKRAANEKSNERWDASQGSATSGSEWASSDDAVCAHMWQRITRARALPADATVTFDRHVDMRTRLDPPLPSDYIGSGNAGPPRLSIPAGELLDKTLGQVAQRLRRELLQMGEPYLRALLRKFRSSPFVPHFLARAPPFGTAVRVTSWAKFPVYGADFGGGRPDLVTLSELPPFFDGVVEIQQTPQGDGGLDVVVFLQEEHLARLRADPELHPAVTTRY